MARKWQEREGTVEPGQETKTQEDIVEELRALAKHSAVAVPTPAAKVAPGSAVVHAVCAGGPPDCGACTVVAGPCTIIVEELDAPDVDRSTASMCNLRGLLYHHVHCNCLN